MIRKKFTFPFDQHLKGGWFKMMEHDDSPWLSILSTTLLGIPQTLKSIQLSIRCDIIQRTFEGRTQQYMEIQCSHHYSRRNQYVRKYKIWHEHIGFLQDIPLYLDHIVKNMINGTQSNADPWHVTITSIREQDNLLYYNHRENSNIYLPTHLIYFENIFHQRSPKYNLFKQLWELKL